MKKFLALPLTVGLLATSCSTPKGITYFEDIKSGENTSLSLSKEMAIKVKPEDKLIILVTTQDASLTSLFNLVQAQSRIAVAGTSVGVANGNDGRTAYYTVDSKGDINFPLLGEIHIAGMKREDVAKFIEDKLVSEDLVKQPVVTVEFANLGVSVLGEVAHPGHFEFNKDKLSLLDALALAGDLKNTGIRENVLVIRNEDGKQVTYTVDLTNAKSLSASPAYYLQQDDIVYVEPNLKSKRETTSAGNTPYSPSFWLSVGSIGLTVATLIVTISK